MANARQNQNRRPVLEALTHDVLNGDTFTTFADLADAVKCAAARRRIPYDSDDVAAAIRSVEARRPVLVATPRPTRALPVVDDAPPAAAGPVVDVRALVASLLAQVRTFPPGCSTAHEARVRAQAKAQQQADYLAERAELRRQRKAGR
jgi:hypothetical protein